MNENVCNDNRFNLIAKYKAKLIEATNIETSQDEMAVMDNILFRMWQMGWLDKLDAAPPWHRVEEKPTQEGKYLVCDEMNNFYVVWWGPILGWCYNPKRFRYWMPIEPPKGE